MCRFAAYIQHGGKSGHRTGRQVCDQLIFPYFIVCFAEIAFIFCQKAAECSISCRFMRPFINQLTMFHHSAQMRDKQHIRQMIRHRLDILKQHPAQPVAFLYNRQETVLD